MYNALNITECTQLVAAIGHTQTVLVEGHMGWGKSSMLTALKRMFPKHLPCYFDCTTKDLGDIAIPNLIAADSDSGFVRYLTNEELGMHHDQPIILMIDEYGKANPAVKNSLLRLIQERKIGSYTLHADSLQFATTNLGAEGVGDMLKPHSRNRMTIVPMRKPTNREWIEEWALHNNVEPTVMGWARDTPEMCDDFRDHAEPDANQYIYHPKSTRTSFVTGRSLEASSHLIKAYLAGDLSENTLECALVGTIGAKAAQDLGAYVRLVGDIPKMEDIKNTPDKAKVPESISAVCMVVDKALMTVDHSWVNAWMTYMARLPREAQAMFVNSLRKDTFPAERRDVVMTAKDMGQWARDFGYLFTNDQ